MFMHPDVSGELARQRRNRYEAEALVLRSAGRRGDGAGARAGRRLATVFTRVPWRRRAVGPAPLPPLEPVVVDLRDVARPVRDRTAQTSGGARS